LSATVFPARPGTYVVLLAATRRRRVSIGRLGALALRAGCYCYVGSAFGPGGLRARLQHHLGIAHRLHWHIDYLRRVTTPTAVWFSDDPQRHECRWAQIIGALPGAEMPLTGFGASDCNCATHLFHFDKAPAFDAFERRLAPATAARRSRVQITAIDDAGTAVPART
jgi:Uri superfamily endonuclease